MEEIMQGWLSIWLYVMTAIGVVLSYLVYKNRKTWSKLNILCTLAVIVLVLHVIEEWVLPGGLHYSYNINHGSMYLSKYPMNRLTDMITNFGAVVVGCIVLKVWGFRKPAGIATMLFSAFEVVMHISIGIQDMQIFGKYGMNTLYSPGLITSLFGFLPVCVGIGIHLFKKEENRPKPMQWIMAIVATAALGFLLINLPEAILSSENNSYEFTDRGYYEKYGELFELDNGYEYFEPEAAKEEQ
ncbi:MAG: HXXEE domain-containing protein [Agathobacter sp.]